MQIGEDALIAKLPVQADILSEFFGTRSFGHPVKNRQPGGCSESVSLRFGPDCSTQGHADTVQAHKHGVAIIKPKKCPLPRRHAFKICTRLAA